MNQHQVRIMNTPELSSEELYVKKASEAHGRGRLWAEQAVADNLPAYFPPVDRMNAQHLIEEARARRLLLSEGCDAVSRLARSCGAMLSVVAKPDTSGARSRAMVLGSHEVELDALAADIGQLLDLEHALKARRALGK